MVSESRIDWAKMRCNNVGGEYIKGNGTCSIPDNKLDKILMISAWGFDVRRLEFDESGNEVWVPRLQFGNNPAWAWINKDGKNLMRVDINGHTLDRWIDKYPRAIKKMELDYIDYLERPAKIGIYYRERKLNNWNEKWALGPEEGWED